MLQEALKPDAVPKNQYAIPLLIKLSTFSKDVAEILVKDVGHLSKFYTKRNFKWLFGNFSVSFFSNFIEFIRCG